MALTKQKKCAHLREYILWPLSLLSALLLFPPHHQMSIWDTAGVERFRTLTRNYYRNAHAAVFIYSVTDVSSLHFLTQWEKDTQNFAPNAIRMLIGNKCDMEPEVDEYTAEQFSKMHDFDRDAVISCKTGKGIHEAFEGLARLLHERGDGEGNPHSEGVVAVTAGTTSVTPGNKGGGCTC